MARHHNKNGVEVPFTAEEETARDIEEQQEADKKADYIANHKYKDDRKNIEPKYKLIADQLDMIYWDRKNNTNLWEQHIDEVKTAHTKSN